MIRYAIFIICGTMMFGGMAQASHDDFWVWRQMVVHGETQSVELILASDGCNKPFTVAVETTDQGGLITHELLHVPQQRGGVVYPLPAYYGFAERNRIVIKLEVEPGPCANALQAVLAIINEDGTTAAVSRIPRHTPEWTDFNANDPGISAVRGGPNSYINVHATRIGPDQVVEFTFRNNCPEEISVALELRTIGTEDEEVIPLNVDVAPLSVASVDVQGDGQSVHIAGFGTFAVKHRSSDANPCPPGLGALTGTLSLVDAQGNTTHASGLPTGKRQHKPVNVTNAE